jgi:uncharacterized metal-binding protein
MAVTAKVLARTAASLTTTTVLYTVPTTTTSTVVTNIAVTNTAGSAGTFTLAIDGIALHTTTAIAANTTVYIDCKQVIPANATPKTITGGASATSINFHVSGVEIV